MTDSNKLPLKQLRSIPLLHELNDDELSQLAVLFSLMKLETGAVLFEAGDPADAFYFLVAGEVTLKQPDQETYNLHPPAVIGELGALTGLRRNSQAVVGKRAKIWSVSSQSILEFFDKNKEIGMRVHQHLLHMVADKVNRDQTRLQDMRKNIIRTQKAMKRMRDFLLESQDTVVSGPLHETIEEMIRHNRRVNYRVEIPVSIEAKIRFDDRSEAKVVEISRTHISYRRETGDLPKVESRISGVLYLNGPEIPVSGKILRTIGRRVDLELDLLIDEYVATLEGFLTCVQMLDFLV